MSEKGDIWQRFPEYKEHIETGETYLDLDEVDAWRKEAQEEWDELETLYDAVNLDNDHLIEQRQKANQERDEANQKLRAISEITLPSSFNEAFPNADISDLKAQVQSIITGKKYKAKYNQRREKILEDSPNALKILKTTKDTLALEKITKLADDVYRKRRTRLD